jgi:hypothetical protein
MRSEVVLRAFAGIAALIEGRRALGECYRAALGAV